MSGIYKNGDYYYLRYKLNGKWLYKSLSTKNKREAKTRLKEFEIDLINKKNSIDPHNLSYLIHQYLQHSIANKSLRTQKDDYEVTGKFLNFLGNVRISEITPSDILSYINNRKLNSSIGISRSRIELSVIRAMFNCGMRLGIINNYPFGRGRIQVGQAEKRSEYMSKKQIITFLTAVDRIELWHYFVILLMTGW